MRNISKWLAIGTLMATGGTALVAVADEAPATPPAPTTRPGRTVKVDKPYSELPDLTNDQKTQIISIEQAANKEIDDIRRKERADITDLLSDDQKKELAEAEAKAREEAAARRKAKLAATTRPSEG